MKPYRLFVGFFLFMQGLTLGVLPIHAQSYPGHSIQVVIPGAPGDAADIACRLLIEELGKILKIQLVPINKPGGGGTAGSDFVAKGKKDAYTLLYGNTSAIIYSPALSPESAPYDPIRDLDPLGLHVYFPTVISVQNDAPWENFNEMIEYALKNPGKLRCGTLGVGSITHFQLEIVKSLTGADMNIVPFKGAMPAVTALLGGHVESACVAVAVAEPQYKSGKLRGILLDQKVPDLPNIPTIQQLGYKHGLPSSWAGLFAPSGIPDEAKKVLIPAIERAVKNPELVGRLQKMWFLSNYKSPDELKQIIIEDYKNACAVVKKMGVTK
jgi:tripartite-type tricarboxylate transporter receptor subunit TctC